METKKPNSSSKEELAKKFNEADLNDFLDKKTTAAGLGVQTSLLDTKAVQGGGPPYIREGGKNMYKKLEAIEWYIEYFNTAKYKFEYMKRKK